MPPVATHSNGHSEPAPQDEMAILARKAAVPNRVMLQARAGQLAHSFSLKQFNSIDLVHYAAVTGYDAIFLDLEHGSFGLETCHTLSCAALQVGITPMVRVPANSSEWISRALDGGAQAVIVPHINSPAEAANVVRYAKFQPVGERSATSGMPALRYASVPAKYANPVVNENTTVICMIETGHALDIVDEIAAVPGVDILLIGSSDLTADLGIPGEFDSPLLADAYARVAAACERASVNGRQLYCGIGGLNGRPDLIEKFALAHPRARYAMSGADNMMLLNAMKAGGKKMQDINARVVAAAASSGAAVAA